MTISWYSSRIRSRLGQILSLGIGLGLDLVESLVSDSYRSLKMWSRQCLVGRNFVTSATGLAWTTQINSTSTFPSRSYQFCSISISGGSVEEKETKNYCSGKNAVEIHFVCPHKWV